MTTSARQRDLLRRRKEIAARKAMSEAEAAAAAVAAARRWRRWLLLERLRRLRRPLWLLFWGGIAGGIAFFIIFGESWPPEKGMSRLAQSQKEFLLAIGLEVIGLGILIYVLIIRPDAADRKKLESGPAEKQDEPGCARVIIYIIIILAALLGIMDWFLSID
ncbi:hypothetical protein OAF43_00860 [bacterium]|nr:hypothetical protein [bacterium]